MQEAREVQDAVNFWPIQYVYVIILCLSSCSVCFACILTKWCSHLLKDNLQVCFHMCISQAVTCGFRVMSAVYHVGESVNQVCKASWCLRPVIAARLLAGCCDVRVIQKGSFPVLEHPQNLSCWFCTTWYEGWNFNFGNTPLDWTQELLEWRANAAGRMGPSPTYIHNESGPSWNGHRQ